jgi:NAD(P)-dependent dehydrogenase (short-subunit alcohol dehydrogenase family)
MTEFGNACAVVTGGAGGIGRSLAKALAARGARVAVADISEDGAAATAAEVGHGAAGYRCDVCDQGDVERLAAAAARDLGRINFVFANAGVYAAGKLIDTDPQAFRCLFDVNVGGVFHTIQAFAPMLLQAAARGGPARFVLTGSENSVGLPTLGVNTAYTATKHALLGMADGLRRDLEGSGVGVSILCPGAVNTGIWNSGRARQPRYGGETSVEPQAAAATRRSLAANAQDPDLTAQLCLEGVSNDEFMIIADPKIRTFALDRNREVERALDRLDLRVGSAGRAVPPPLS